MPGKIKILRRISMLLLLMWLSGVLYLTMRPFGPVAGRGFPQAEVGFSEKGARFAPGAALEIPRGASLLRSTLGTADRMTLEVSLTPELDSIGGPARIISLSRGPMERNFTLAQEGNAVVFRLSTEQTDHSAQYQCLLIPKVFKAGQPIHLGLVYDGTFSRLYVDGEPRGEPRRLGGGFSVWAKNYALVLGDEVTGARPWEGTIQRFSFHDRALERDELKLLAEGGEVEGAVLAHDFQGVEKELGVRPLRYRNLFVFFDRSTLIPEDCLSNIAGFLPMALLLYGCTGFRRMWCGAGGWVIAALAGLLISSLIELMQRGIDGRVPCLADIAYNTLGAGLGFAVVAIMIRRKQKILNTGENA